MKYGKKFHGRLLASALAVSLMITAATADAQTTQSPAASSELGEIIVTAQKREQRLSDVGESISVATGLQLQDAGVTDIYQLTTLVPGFSVARSQFGFPILSIRGVNFAGLGLSSQPTVGTYVDEALLAYPAMTQGAFLDVERVEVLKGPQGTLFGENVTGGAINIIANKPTDHFTAGIRGEFNNFGGMDLESYVSGPLASTVNARFAVSTDQWGAWQQCYSGCAEKNGNAHRGVARLLLDWKPIDILKVELNVNGNYDDSQPQVGQLQAKNIQVLPGYPGLATYPIAPHNDRAADFGGFEPIQYDHTYQTVLRADLDLDKFTITSLTNYANTRRYVSLDGDSTALPLAFNQTFGNIHSFNQELRLSGKVNAPDINYVIGANYQQDHVDDGNTAQYDGYSGFPPGASLGVDNPVYYSSKGLFASADWEFVKDLTLTAGARYAWANEGVKGCIADGGNGLIAGEFNYISNLERAAEGLPATTGYFLPGGCFALDDRPVALNTPGAFLPYDADLTQREHNISWKGGLNYKLTPDTLLYAAVSRGFKAGGFPVGFNVTASQIDSPIKQEELTNYEIGTKFSAFERKLELSSAIFYYDYVNKQFLTDEPGPVGIQQVIQNIPKSSVKGAEAEITVRPLAGLTLRTGVTYIDTRVGDFRTYNGLGDIVNVGGNAFNYAPKWSGNFDSEYRFPLGDKIGAFFDFSGSFASQTFADLGDSPIYRLPEYILLNARAGADLGNGWTASIFIRNIADRYYLNDVTTAADTFTAFTGLPRTYGLSVSYKFN